MKALDGLRMIDLTHMLSGPYCGMLLADLGVETIKVEPPGSGEGTRRLLAGDARYHRDGMNAYFLTLNRNKKSVTMNLKSSEGLALFYELVRDVDIVLDNFSAGVTDRLKIGHAHLAAINPRIITCTITGFGESGPARDWPAFDMVAQAMGGGMTLTGKPGEPQRSGIPIGDLGGGLMGVIGILSAVVARATTGRGQHVDVSMLDAQLSLQNYVATMYAMSGVVPAADANEHPVHVPYNTFPTEDGHIIIAIITDDFWKNLMTVVPLPELDTEEHHTAAGRRRSRTRINQRLAEVFQTGTKAHWLERLRAARIPCAPVNTVADAVEQPQTLARNMMVDVNLLTGETVRMPGNPIKLSETNAETYSPPPRLGADTDEVLTTLLGKNEAQLSRLRELGAI
ncbi:MAG TPA: CoA transferase [Thermoflexales bacterium]|nr:CoA transferase [Thermoflexales bacterium]